MNIKQFYKYKNWYRHTRSLLIKKYGKDYKLYAGLLASTSPRFSIKRNFNTADSIYMDYIKNRIEFLQYFKDNQKKVLKKYKLLYAHYNNIIRVLENNLVKNKDFKLGGLKVNSFYHNLIGHYEYVTLDIWMIKYFKLNKGQLNIGDYKKYSRIIRKLSFKMGLYPAELQAVLWQKIRHRHNVKPQNFYQYITV